MHKWPCGKRCSMLSVIAETNSTTGQEAAHTSRMARIKQSWGWGDGSVGKGTLDDINWCGKSWVGPGLYLRGESEEHNTHEFLPLCSRLDLPSCLRFLPPSLPHNFGAQPGIGSRVNKVAFVRALYRSQQEMELGSYTRGIVFSPKRKWDTYILLPW